RQAEEQPVRGLLGGQLGAGAQPRGDERALVRGQGGRVQSGLGLAQGQEGACAQCFGRRLAGGDRQVVAVHHLHEELAAEEAHLGRFDSGLGEEFLEVAALGGLPFAGHAVALRHAPLTQAEVFGDNHHVAVQFFQNPPCVAGDDVVAGFTGTGKNEGGTAVF
ncbi:unnamed protein product, partial [Heterosigma akashiwo]